MKTGILLLGLLVLGFLSFAYGESAYSTNAYYAVMFDDRGLASAALRLDYVNNGQEASDHIAFRIPGRDVKIVSAYIKESCLPENRSARDYGYYYYDDCPYPGYRFVPANLSALGEGSYSIAFNGSIGKGSGTSVLIFYRAFGYAEDSLTGKRFDFETPRFEFDVDSTRVAIDVDEDLLLKEGGSEGSYSQVRSAVLAGSQSGSSGALQSALSSSYMYVGYASGYVRDKSVLLSGEIFTVSGNYGKEWLQLYLPEVSAILLLLAGAGWFVKKKAGESAAIGAGKSAARQEAHGSMGDAAVFAFTCAVGFAFCLSIAFLGLKWSKGEVEGGVSVLAVLAAWLGCASYVFIRKSREGTGIAAVMMFLGFSVIVAPFMLLLAAWIYSSLIYRPYYL